MEDACACVIERGRIVEMENRISSCLVKNGLDRGMATRQVPRNFPVVGGTSQVMREIASGMEKDWGRDLEIPTKRCRDLRMMMEQRETYFKTIIFRLAT